MKTKISAGTGNSQRRAGPCSKLEGRGQRSSEECQICGVSLCFPSSPYHVLVSFIPLSFSLSLCSLPPFFSSSEHFNPSLLSPVNLFLSSRPHSISSPLFFSIPPLPSFSLLPPFLYLLLFYFLSLTPYFILLSSSPLSSCTPSHSSTIIPHLISSPALLSFIFSLDSFPSLPFFLSFSYFL